ncbi:hypothetical protein PSAB6_30395 [Paraburkholderia sabiae]|nr:hypothetical protein PSAB6_30395 [Paraburkholderia sabiae]
MTRYGSRRLLTFCDREGTDPVSLARPGVSALNPKSFPRAGSKEAGQQSFVIDLRP